MKKLKIRELAKVYGVKIKQYNDSYEVVYPMQKHLTARVALPKSKQAVADYFRHEDERDALLDSYYAVENHEDTSVSAAAKQAYESFVNPIIQDEFYDATKITRHVKRLYDIEQAGS